MYKIISFTLMYLYQSSLRVYFPDDLLLQLYLVRLENIYSQMWQKAPASSDPVCHQIGIILEEESVVYSNWTFWILAYALIILHSNLYRISEHKFVVQHNF